jgi:hypothetical protein
MQIQYEDFKDADAVIKKDFAKQWRELEDVITTMPLHLKASNQKGRQGTTVFDPVATNNYIKTALAARGWQFDVPIPERFRALGKHVDFAKGGVLLEVQFSHYFSAADNTNRGQVFIINEVVFHEVPVAVAILLTKAHMLPSANSSLYYEQARDLLRAYGPKFIQAPIRVVGLFENPGPVLAHWTDYTEAEHSRTAETQGLLRVDISQPDPVKGSEIVRCNIAKKGPYPG